MVAQCLPFNALAVFWDPGQWGYLAGVYGLLFLPFFMAATSIGAVLRFGGPRISQIYAADLCGAGIGEPLRPGFFSACRRKRLWSSWPAAEPPRPCLRPFAGRSRGACC
jgi:hypothetical protein